MLSSCRGYNCSRPALVQLCNFIRMPDAAKFVEKRPSAEYHSTRLIFQCFLELPEQTERGRFVRERKDQVTVILASKLGDKATSKAAQG